MKCRDIQQKLSAYSEGIVPSEERILIEEHLESCPKCSEFLADLRKTIDYVHSIRDVEPPAWLTQKVMAKIKAEAQPKKGIIQKLFYPLHIKLPLEAVVTALIVVITIYIFRTIPPEMKRAQAPSEHESVIARSTSKVDDKSISKEKIAPPLDRNDREKPLLLSPPLEKGPVTRSQRLIERKEGFEAEQPVPAKKPMIMDKLEKVPQTPAQIAEQDEVRPSAGAVTKEKAKTEVSSRASKTKVLDERKEAISMSIRVKDIKTASKEIEKTLIQLAGKIAKTEFSENKELVTAEIDSQKLKEFIANLKSIGEVEEKEMDLKTLEGHVEIAIEIMKKP
jgi:hypothetical protein